MHRHVAAPICPGCDLILPAVVALTSYVPMLLLCRNFLLENPVWQKAMTFKGPGAVLVGGGVDVDVFGSVPQPWASC